MFYYALFLYNGHCAWCNVQSLRNVTRSPFNRRSVHTVLPGYYTFKLGHCLINQLFRHLLSGQFDFNEWSVTQCFYIHGFYLISDLKVFASGIFVHCLVARAASGEYDILG